MDTLTAPCFSPFQVSHDDDRKQDSPLLNLPTSVLDNIVSHIPLKVRTLMVAPVCRALRDSVYRSITSVAFYKTQLDELSDTRIKYFLSIHGHKITAINFDLFRSVEDVIFRECPQLQVLCIDAQYLSGHCFQVAPVGLQRLELEMCLRISEASIRSIFARLKKLKVLYVSELRILKDSIIAGLVSNLKNLRDLSIVANPETPNLDPSASALGHLARLPRLQNLCLEGLPAVTDRFLAELSDVSTNAAARTITSLSIGLQRLARMPKLDSLNLDGITKRDISSGLVKIAEEGRLVRVRLL
ncbi:F-box domain protein [Ancylostoma duodenale]|uniref:F-box domain protein n=1 Tax=Ancylostoma duodenale TaxID=51022 RepID=A0A0C2GE62_9BILA|nr:F-box domain protein [Ancylostoma duodenale]